MSSTLDIIKRAFGSHQVRLLCLLMLPLASRWPGHDSEDIKNLRINAHSSSPTDFWGGTSSMFYGHFPNFYPGWETLLLISQWGLTSIGLILLTKKVRRSWKVQAVWFIISILIVELGTLLTRDGLMLALLVFGYGLINSSGISSPKHRKIFLTTSFLAFLVAASFRPWVSPAIVVLYIYLSNLASNSSTWQRKFIKRIVLLFIFVTLALSFEIGSSKILNLGKSYPEQQVILMDLAPMACWSTNQNTVDLAISGLKNFYSKKELPPYFCNTFRPTNWVHLFHQDLLSKQAPDFRLLQVGDMHLYEETKSIWLKLIFSSPVDYIQNKLMYGSQTLVGGDTRGIKLVSDNYFENTERSRIFAYMSAVILLPLDVAITLHLFSPFVSLLLFCSILVFASIRPSERFRLSDLLGLWFFCIFWFTGTIVAYIGDTARFTYTSGALILTVLAFSEFQSRKVEGFSGKD